MKIFVLGTAGDVRGFALAGVEGRTAGDPGEVRSFLERIRAGREDIGLLLLSEMAARGSSGEIAELVRTGRPPAILILPEARG